MGSRAILIPEKIYFKIGEVCELVGVQAHVLRYWETEFPMLSPQKNRSGQRSYRRRDVEIALRIKQLLYDEMFTIAGAKKKLHSDMRESSKLKIVHPEPAPAPTPREYSPAASNSNPGLFDSEFDGADELDEIDTAPAMQFDGNQREAIKSLASQLLELREMLRNKSV